MSPARLHIGCGEAILDGWVNVDAAALPGIDQVLDVREGLPFDDVELIFAEHFIEHLPLGDALAFFRECRRVLRPDGVLRISTPNLDWVWLTHYRPPRELSGDEAMTACLEINRAFHGWGHQFLWNEETLRNALRSAGFEKVTPCSYGESKQTALRGLERHERAKDLPEATHVLIVEARGTARDEAGFAEKAGPYLRDLKIR